MKFLKKTLFVLASLVAIILIIALFAKKDYDVNRTIKIERAKSEVFDYIRYLQNHEEFTVWSSMDPTMEKNYSGIDGKVGVIYSWNSDHKDVGVGEQEITNIKEGELIDYELRFLEPMEMVGNAYFKTTSDENSTIVTWGFKGEAPWPFNIFFLFTDMDGELGPDLEKGLENLKEVLESNE